MIEKIISYSIHNRFVVIAVAAAVAALGVYSMYRTPVDAIPDLSENQVIVFADWMGRSPREVEDQVTYPLSVNLQGLAGVKAIRATSEFGFSMINIIFEDKIDFYFARTRVLERLAIAETFLPAGIKPYLAPDATALGQIFWYTVEGEGQDLGRLRAIQDWFVRYQLQSVPGVAEVASVGGFPIEYQIDVDPNKLRGYGITLGELYSAVASSNSSVGGRVLQKGGSEFLIRSVGWIQSLKDVEQIVVKSVGGTPIYVANLASVQYGSAARRTSLEKNGSEAVGGVVLMRYGENPLEITGRIKDKIVQLQAGLPEGVRIVPFYDRTRLIEAAIDTVSHTVLEEILVASAAVILVMWHVRSALIICLTLPMAVLFSFIMMRWLNIPSNIMSLSGIAISIGVLVDAAIVMVDQGVHTLYGRFGNERIRGDTRELLQPALQTVGRPIFFAMLIMLLSFTPVFALSGMEGRMFHPLAFTKTFALLGVSILAITLVPALIPWLIRGRVRHEEDNWLVRQVIEIYRPVLNFLMDHPWPIIWVTGVIMLLGVTPGTPNIVVRQVFLAMILGSALWAARTWRGRAAMVGSLLIVALLAHQYMKPLGSEFMPSLDEGTILDMPVTIPRASITQVAADLQARDALLRQFPEVELVVGKAGRAETPTDPSPPDMLETIVNLRPREYWPKREMRYDDALAETDEALERLVDGNFTHSTDRIVQRQAVDAVVASVRRMLETLSSYDVMFSTLAERDRTAFIGETASAVNRGLEVPLNAGEIVLPTAWYEEARRNFVNDATMHAVGEFDRQMRQLALDRLRQFESEEGLVLGHFAVEQTVGLLRAGGKLSREVTEEEIQAIADQLASQFGPALVTSPDQVLTARIARAVSERLRAIDAVRDDPDLLTLHPGPLGQIAADVADLMGRRPSTFFTRLLDEIKSRLHDDWLARVKTLNWELIDQAASIYTAQVADQLRRQARLRGLWLAGDDGVVASGGDTPSTLSALEKELRDDLAARLFLWQKSKDSLLKELDTFTQVPGWANIWTQPIINRVNMLATGVRTQVGVKIFGNDLQQIQRVSEQVAAAVRNIRGASDVTADQIVGEGYLEIDIDREKAARYGVNIGDIQDVVETALGGRVITTTVEGRERFPVRVRYARAFREDEESVKNLLVSASGGGSMAEGERPGSSAASTAPASAPTAMTPARPGGSSNLSGPAQIPLAMLADVRIVEGPSMIKSENGLLRSYVQLNVRDRDALGFVEEARRAVEQQVALPAGMYLEWSGEFEHQMHARRTLTLIVPIVLLVIFVLLYITYHDLADTLLVLLLAVPGAVAGGMLFQYLFGFNFSVAVWVGYIACFGLATQSGLVMLVYLREAIDRRGGLEKIGSLAEVRAAIMEGAVHRTRPKLLTETTTIVGLAPMLWAKGVGAEIMRPMAAPVLGGLLVSDEIIDLLLPVLFYRIRAWRWNRLHPAGKKTAGRQPTAAVP